MTNDNNKDNNNQSSAQASSGSTVSDIISSNPQPTMRPVSEGFTLNDDDSSEVSKLNDGD